MSIKTFIEAAKILAKENHYHEALCLTCIAVDACAAQIYTDKNVTERYKLFLSQHFRTITNIGFPGISADAIRIKVNANIPNLKTDGDGYVDMEQIIYHVLRCGLVHNCEIEKSIIFSEKTMIGDWNTNEFYMPKSLMWGLIAAIEEV